MKTVQEFEAGLKAVESKTKADILAFVALVIAALKVKEDAENNDPVIADLKTKVADLETELETAKKIALDATEKFNSHATDAPKGRNIKIDDKVYKINHGVNLNGKDYTADDLAGNEDVVAELIEMQSTAVSLKEGK